RVLRMPGRVPDDELARGRGEVAISNVYRDALLSLGQQPVGQQGQIDGRKAAPARGRLQGCDLIRQQPLAVVEEAADQGALAVVDAACGDEAQQPGVAGRIPLPFSFSLEGRGNRRNSPLPSRERVTRGGRSRARHQKYPSFLRNSIAASL